MAPRRAPASAVPGEEVFVFQTVARRIGLEWIELRTELVLPTRARGYGSARDSESPRALSLTEGLAAALRGHGVAVFAIGPGAVPTGLIEHIYESSADEWFPPKAARKWTPPERAAELALLLASGKADGLSGRFLHVGRRRRGSRPTGGRDTRR